MRSSRPCPSYQVEIHGDGRVIFDGYRDVAAVGHREAHIAKGAVRALFAKFRAAHFFALPNERVMDSSSRVSIAFDDQQKSLPGEEHGVSGLGEAIDKAANTAQWVGHHSDN